MDVVLSRESDLNDGHVIGAWHEIALTVYCLCFFNIDFLIIQWCVYSDVWHSRTYLSAYYCSELFASSLSTRFFDFLIFFYR